MPPHSNQARTLLAGTALTVSQLEHVLEVAEPWPRVIGCVVPRPDETAVCARPPVAPILGELGRAADIAADERVEQVLICLPAPMAALARRLGAELTQRGIGWRSLPALADQLAGRASGGAASSAGEIDTLQLINRRPRPLDERAIAETLRGRTVLITGAGGSIGSELARMVVRFKPQSLILVERSENALFEIDRELAGRVQGSGFRVQGTGDSDLDSATRHREPATRITPVLHDITDAPRTALMIGRCRPDVIFHAAAHKHVPMMEDHPAEAVENNFYGTRSVADAADAAGVERFVMISTDKAVNPSSVMGASKRLAELYIQHRNRRSRTVYSMVRFGNVLGSACSVLPIWSRQLATGGPVTVTHPQMTRYFMTIPEAAGLVIQSATFAGSVSGSAFRVPGSGVSPLSPGAHVGGEVFLLDMGEPIRILDLARRFIRLQGLEPDVDIPIVFTGPRPGEKLFEELAYDGEDMLPTPHESVRIWRTTPPDDARMKRVIAMFDQLRRKRSDGDHHWQHATRQAILAALHEAVPEMLSAQVAAKVG